MNVSPFTRGAGLGYLQQSTICPYISSSRMFHLAPSREPSLQKIWSHFGEGCVGALLPLRLPAAGFADVASSTNVGHHFSMILSALTSRQAYAPGHLGHGQVIGIPSAPSPPPIDLQRPPQS